MRLGVTGWHVRAEAPRGPLPLPPPPAPQAGTRVAPHPQRAPLALTKPLTLDAARQHLTLQTPFRQLFPN